MFSMFIGKLCLCILSGKMAFTLGLYVEGEAGGSVRWLEALFPRAPVEHRPLPRLHSVRLYLLQHPVGSVL